MTAEGVTAATRLADRDPKWRNHIRAMVDAAPPLTAGQIAKLSALFDDERDSR